MDQLPSDLKLKILECLPERSDVVKLASVNHEWWRIAFTEYYMTLLPSELKLKIMHCLPRTSDVLKLARLNRQWRQFIRVCFYENPEWWKQKCFADDLWREAWEPYSDNPHLTTIPASWKLYYVQWCICRPRIRYYQGISKYRQFLRSMY